MGSKKAPGGAKKSGAGGVKARSGAQAAASEARASGDAASGGRARWLALAAGGAALVVVAGVIAWLAFGALIQRPVPTPARSELEALEQRLIDIQDAIGPIASAFAAEEETGVINVGDYRMRISAARDLVDSTNELPVTTPDAVEIRDLIITGGSQVLSGMSAALDALEADEASATEPAGAQVDEGLAALREATEKLEALLGTKGGA